MVIYSHSRLSTFDKCPIKYKFKYIDELIPDYEQSIEGFLGKKIHETLEWIYNNANNKQIELDDIIKYYIEFWNKDFNREIKIIKKDLNDEYYFNKGIKLLINYFLKHSPFIDNTIATEKKIYFSLDENKEHNFVGFIDRLVHHKDTNIFEIHDYKTGFIKSQGELDKDKQLALYSIAIRDNFENIRDVHLFWHFLEFNEQKTSKRTLEELEQLKKDIIHLINKIESTKIFNPNPSNLCKWCEYRSYCPIIKENPNFPDLPLNKKEILFEKANKSDFSKKF